MTSSEVRLYVALCCLADKHRSAKFTTATADLRKVTGISKPSLAHAIEQLEERHLIWTAGDPKKLIVMLCDPYTGEPFPHETGNAEDDSPNYYITDDKGRSKRVILNNCNPADVEPLVRSCLRDDAAIVHQGNGDFKILCPFHYDVRRRLEILATTDFRSKRKNRGIDVNDYGAWPAHARAQARCITAYPEEFRKV